MMLPGEAVAYDAGTIQGDAVIMDKPNDIELASLQRLAAVLDRPVSAEELAVVARPAELLPGRMWLGDMKSAEPPEVMKAGYTAIINVAPSKTKLSYADYDGTTVTQYLGIDAPDVEGDA